MNRKLAREVAYKLIFTHLFTKEFNQEYFDEMKASKELDKNDLDYIKRTYKGVADNFSVIREIIAKYSKGFVIDRIYNPDLAVLMLAIYEMKYDDSIPIKVSISEGVAIIKQYSTTKSYSFVNGILASVARELAAENESLTNASVVSGDESTPALDQKTEI